MEVTIGAEWRPGCLVRVFGKECGDRSVSASAFVAEKLVGNGIIGCAAELDGDLGVGSWMGVAM